MTINELLPIGSIIILKGAEKKLMIFGVKQTNEQTQEEYDYIGVLYPEGNMGTNTQFLFNHKDIQDVVFEGFKDEERDKFIEHLNEFYNVNNN